jgi:hypothetical protein
VTRHVKDYEAQDNTVTREKLIEFADAVGVEPEREEVQAEDRQALSPGPPQKQGPSVGHLHDHTRYWWRLTWPVLNSLETKNPNE